MRELRHPLSGSLYGLADDGLVRVEKDGRWGLFRGDGRWVAGEVRSADPHLCNWLATQPRPRRRAAASGGASAARGAAASAGAPASPGSPAASAHAPAPGAAATTTGRPST